MILHRDGKPTPEAVIYLCNTQSKWTRFIINLKKKEKESEKSQEVWLPGRKH